MVYSDEKIYLEELDEKQIYGLHDLGFFDELGCNYERVVTSYMNYIISVGNTIVGIVNLDTEYTRDFIFFDLYIIEKEQNKHLGRVITTYIINMFKNQEELLISQTKENNIKANKVLSNLGELVMKYKDNNYYLLSDRSKLTEEKLKKLIDHRYYGNTYKNQYILEDKKDYVLCLK